MNKLFVIGRLGADPEERFTPDGKKVISLRLASNIWNKGKEETQWYDVSYWGDHPLMQHFKKGSLIVVTGEIRLDKWTGKDGQEKTTLRLRADSLGFGPSSRAESTEQQNKSSGFGGPETGSESPAFGQAEGFAAGSTTEDDLPF